MKNTGVLILLFMSFILTSCGGLELEGIQAEKDWKDTFNSKQTLVGTIRNTSANTCSNITLHVKYLNLLEDEIGNELVPINNFSIPKNSVKRFKVKTSNIPEGTKKFRASIDSYTD